MNDLPSAWHWASIDEIAAGVKSNVVIGPFGSSLKVSDYTEVGVPLVFVRNIRTRDFSQAASRYVSLEKARELQPHEVRRGDVLITKMGDPPGDVAVYPDLPAALVTADCIRLRPGPTVEAKFLAYAFEAPVVRQQFQEITRGVAQQKVSLARFRQGVTIPLPPLEEQRRIVDLLEDHLSRLDAAVASLDAADRRLRALRSSQLEETKRLAAASGPVVSLADVAIESRYGTSAKCVADGPGVPVVRIPNLVNGFVDLTDEKCVQDATSDMSGLMLEAGDVLVVRTNGSRDLIGRATVVQPGVDAAFASYLIRFRVDESRVQPLWVRMMFEAPSTRQELESMAASSAGQFNLGLKKLDTVSLPVPPLCIQADLLTSADITLEAGTRLGSQVEDARVRAAALRASLLAAAFSGRLTDRVTNLQELVHV